MSAVLTEAWMAQVPLATSSEVRDVDLLSALDALPQQIVIVDAHGRVTHANRAWRKLMRSRGVTEVTWHELSYVEACRLCLQMPVAQTAAIAEPLGRLLAGDTDAVSGEVAFESEGALRRFEWSARRLPCGSAVLSHHDVTALHAADEERSRFARLADANSDGILIVDGAYRVLYANQVARTMAGARDDDDLTAAMRPLIDPSLLAIATADGIWRGEITLHAADGAEIPAVEVIRFHRVEGATDYYSIVLHDIQQEKRREEEMQNRNVELELAYTRLQAAQEQLLQSEKMASIGQLAAGVAHEINNPIGYVHSNLGTLQDYTRNLITVIEAYVHALESPGEAALAEVDEVRRRLDLDYVVQDLPQLLAESREGIERVKKIVQDLKDFSHAGHGDEWVTIDVHRGLESTLNIVWNEVKYKAEVVKDYGTLPPIECLPSQLNQVFMNLLVNAAQAIPQHGTIRIRTGTQGEQVWIEFADSGCGIPESALAKIFDPFYTTKPVGQGTGLGLSLSYGIVKKHNGRIEVTSTVGQGTTFRVLLPVRQQRAAPASG